MARYESSKQGSENERSLDSYESPFPPEPLCAKRQRSSSPQESDYIQKQVVYNH
jgi:hypothetical protein